MADIVNSGQSADIYKDKLTEYYKKTKTMSILIFDCKDIDKIHHLYKHYFQLLHKMSHYNQKILSTYKLKNKEKAKEFKNTHKKLDDQIDVWREDANKKYMQIKGWHERKKELNDQIYLTENQIAKLKLLYQEFDNKLKNSIMKDVEPMDQYIVHNVNCLVDFIVAIDHDSEKLNSIYRIGNIIRNLNTKSFKEKQTDFEEVYTTICSIDLDNSMKNNLEDILNTIQKRNTLSNCYINKTSEVSDDKILELVKEIHITINMIKNNTDILSQINETFDEHIESSKDILF